jgi:molybdopterin converting factor small subunit
MLVAFLEKTMAKAIIQAITADDIDNLGVLLADISRLTKEADAIKERLKKGGCDSYDGEVFRAVIVKQDRTSYDPRKVELMLGDKVALVERVTNVTSVKVTARQA